MRLNKRKARDRESAYSSKTFRAINAVMPWPAERMYATLVDARLEVCEPERGRFLVSSHMRSMLTVRRHLPDVHPMVVDADGFRVG